MPHFNRLILAGHLCRDVDISYTPSGTAVGKSSIAVNHKYKDQAEVMFLEFAVFGKAAETLAKYAGNKGSALLIEGRLRLEKWQAQDGTNRQRHSMVVDNFTFLSSSGDKQQQGQQEGPPPSDDQEIPF